MGGGRLTRALLPAWACLWLAVPPLGLDDHLLTALKSLATRGSGLKLDLARVPYIPEGNVIKVVGRTLFVEEACSGVHSLFVVAAAVIFFTLWERCSPARTAHLLAATGFWVLTANVARIVLVTVAYDRWKVDLLAGWGHELTGVAVMLGSLGLLWSSDQLCLHVTRGLTNAGRSGAPRRSARKTRGGHADAPSASPDLPETHPGRPGDHSGDTDPTTHWPLFAAGGVWVAVTYGGLGLVQASWAWPFLAVTLSGRQELRQRLDAVPSDLVGDRLGAFVRKSTELVRSDFTSDFGSRSRVWLLRGTSGKALASVDDLFVGHHNLPSCYVSRGYRVTAVGEVPAAVSGVDGVSEIHFVTPSGGSAVLYFACLRRGGLGFSVHGGGSTVRALLDRLAVWRKGARRRLLDRYEPSCQVQLLYEGGTGLTAADRDEARAAFVEFLGAIRAEVAGPAPPARPGF